MDLARRYLGSLERGIEIGASANNRFPGVRAWNVNLPDPEVYQRIQMMRAGEVADISVFATAEHLPFASGSLDFILNSHVIEHMPDTIATLIEWDRALRVGGIVFFIVPHKQRTCDHLRPCTDLRHHLADHALGTTASTDSMDSGSHYHVWVTDGFIALLEHLVEVGCLQWTIDEVEDVDSKAGNGFTVVARKLAVAATLSSTTSARVAFHLLRLDLPFQVQGRSLEIIVQGEHLPRDLQVPRGEYRVQPILEGFPPRPGVASRILVGEEVEAPVIEGARQEGAFVVFRGRNFHSTTWLKAIYPDGSSHSVLPEFLEGELAVDLTGAAVPEEPLRIVPTNPAPGGGRGPTFVAQLSPDVPAYANPQHSTLAPYRQFRERRESDRGSSESNSDANG